MLWSCPEEPGIRAVLLRGEPGMGTPRETADECVSEDEFAEMCAKRKKSARAKARTD